MAKNVDFDEIDDFVRRAEEVERQVKAIVSGETPVVGADKAKKAAAAATSAVPKISLKAKEEEEAEREKERALSKKWASEIAAKEAREEREKWWRLAFFTKGVDVPETPEEAEENKKRDLEWAAKTKKGGEASVTAAAAPKYGGGLHYAKWDSWVKHPDDPVSKEEMQAAEEAREKLQNEAFEKANPGFVASFKADQEKRASSDAAKQRRSDDLKTAGNEAFKRKEFARALNLYAEALSLTPLSEALLNNLAATHLALATAEREREKEEQSKREKEREVEERLAKLMASSTDASASQPAAASKAAAEIPVESSSFARNLCLAIEFATRSAWLHAGLWEKPSKENPNGLISAGKPSRQEEEGEKRKKAKQAANRAGLLSSPNGPKALFRRAQACLQLDSVMPASATAALVSSHLLEIPPPPSPPPSSPAALIYVDPIEAREKRSKEQKLEKGRLLFTQAWKDGALAGLVEAGLTGAVDTQAQTTTAGSSPSSSTGQTPLPFHLFPWLCQAIADLTLASDLLSPASSSSSSSSSSSALLQLTPAEVKQAEEIKEALSRAKIELQERMAERQLSMSAPSEAPSASAAPTASPGVECGIVAFVDRVAAKLIRVPLPLPKTEGATEVAVTEDELLLLAEAVVPEPASISSSSATTTANGAAASAVTSVTSPLFSSLKVSPPRDKGEREAGLLRLRTSGLLEALLRAAKASVESLVGDAASTPLAPLSPAALGAAFSLFAACARHNAKQRLMVVVDVEGGVLGPACSLAIALASALEENEKVRLEKAKTANGGGKSSAALSASSAALLSSYSSIGTAAARIFDFFDCFAASTSKDDDEGGAFAKARALITSHPGLLLPHPASGVHSAVEKMLLAGAYRLQSDRLIEFKATSVTAAAATTKKKGSTGPSSNATSIDADSSAVDAAAAASALLQHLALDRHSRDVCLSKASSTSATAPSSSLSGLVPCLLYLLSSLVAESGTALWHALQRHQKQLQRAAAAAATAASSSNTAGGLTRLVLEEAELAATHALTTYRVQVAVGALANLAQVETLRKDFVFNLPQAASPFGEPASSAAASPSTATSSSSSLAPLVSLLALPGYDAVMRTEGGGDSLARRVAIVRGSSVAALANATVGFPSVVDALAATENALPLLLALLPLPAKTKGAAALAAPPLTLQVCSYAALLLGRISSHPSIVAKLAAPPTDAAASPSPSSSTSYGLVKLLTACCDLKARMAGTKASASARSASTSTAIVSRGTSGDEIPPILPPSPISEEALVSALASPWAISSAASAPVEDGFLSTICDGLIRTWAAILSSPSSSSPDAVSPLEVFVMEGGVEAVSSVVASILDENAAAKKAAGSNNNKTPFLRAAALGNACKIAITLASTETSGAGFVVSASMLLSSGLIDGLVGALKATSSLLSPTGVAAGAGAAAAEQALIASAQKNAAVALARLLKDKDGAAGSRIRELRGLEVLMTMGAGIAAGK